MDSLATAIAPAISLSRVVIYQPILYSISHYCRCSFAVGGSNFQSPGSFNSLDRARRSGIKLGYFLLPIAVKRPSSMLFRTLSLWESDHFLQAVCQSLATDSNVKSFALLNLICFFFSEGSIPSDTNFFSSRFPRASPRDHYKHPTLKTFCLPRNGIESPVFEPLGVISRCIPCPSVSLKGLSEGLVVLT